MRCARIRLRAPRFGGQARRRALRRATPVADIVSQQELIDRVAPLRLASRTVALANGCFDLLHVGHVRYLEGAAQEADILVVAINDDPSVRQLKGDGRPILSADQRAELV